MMDEGKLSIPFFPDTEDIRQGTKKLTDMICHTEDYKCYQKDLTDFERTGRINIVSLKNFVEKVCIYSLKKDRNNTLKK